MNCGCEIGVDTSTEPPKDKIVFCSLHSAAGDMLYALHISYGLFEESEVFDMKYNKAIKAIKKLITRAEGKE